LRLVRAELEERGFRVLAAETGAEALRLARSDWPDVGVLSLRLPDMDGFTLLQRLRNWKELSTIFVGRGNSRGQAVEALDAGADDYLTWPFNPEELVARLRALLRRAQGASRLPPVLQEGGLQIDLGHARVTRRGQTITLTPTEWRLLVEFITHPRQVLSYRELLPRVSPHALARRPGLLRSWVWRLRNKLEADPDQPALIKTVPGMGYLFDIEIYRAPGSLAPAETGE
jgi:two-component system KDP operon response regulator KdpE